MIATSSLLEREAAPYCLRRSLGRSVAGSSLMRDLHYVPKIDFDLVFVDSNLFYYAHQFRLLLCQG